MAHGDKHGYTHHFIYPETIKSNGMRRKTKYSTPFMLIRDNQVRWHAEKKHGHPYLLFHPETIKFDGTRRQTMVNRTIFAIQRQSSLMTRRDKAWSSKPLLLSKDNQVRWHAETKLGHPHHFCYPETIKADVLQRQNMVIRTLFCYLKTIKFDGT